jgi:CysZ protein
VFYAPGVVGEFIAGVGLLGRGIGMYARSPRLVVLGIIPALISGLLFVAAFVTLIFFVSDLADLLTWFADEWSEGLRDVVQFLAAIGILGLGGLIGVLTFTAVTLLIGDPFYEKISQQIEERFGGVPGEIEVPWWRSLRRSLWDSLRLIALSVAIGIPLFFLSLLPLIGQTVIPVIGALIGGWFLALELVGVPFFRRGMRLPDRRRILGANRSLALGFGVSVFVCFLIPLGAVLVMPAAVAGGTLLARKVLDLPIDAPVPAPGPPPGRAAIDSQP